MVSNIPSIFPTAVFQAGFGEEAHYGSGYATGTNIGVLGVAMQLETFKLNNKYEVLYNLGSRVGETAYVQGLEVELDAKFVLAADQKNWLSLALNKEGSTTNYWTVPALTGTLPSGYSIIEDQLQHYYSVSGLMVKSFDIDFEEGKTVDVTMSMLGKTVSYLGTTTPSGLVSSTLFKYPSDFTTWAAVQVSYDGNYGSTTFSVQPIKSMKLTVNNNPKAFYGLGNIDYIAFVPQKLEVSGSIDILHDSNLLEHFMRTVESQSSTQGYNITITVGSSEYSTPYTITIEGMFWDTGGMKLTPVDPVVDNLTFKALNVKVS